MVSHAFAAGRPAALLLPLLFGATRAQAQVVELVLPHTTEVSTQFLEVRVFWCGTSSLTVTHNGASVTTSFSKTQGSTCSGDGEPVLTAGVTGSGRVPQAGGVPQLAGGGGVQLYTWTAKRVFTEDSPMPAGDNVFSFRACNNDGCRTTYYTIRVTNLTPPQVTIVSPQGDGVFVFVDQLRVDYSGGTINVSKIKATIDGADKTSSFTKTTTSSHWNQPVLGSGMHTVQYRVCNTSACSVAAQQFSTEGTIEQAWEPEDIIPIPEGVALEQVLVPGALPVPEHTGCPAVAGHPWVWAESPRFEWAHWHPVGHVFKAAILRNKSDIHFRLRWLKPSSQNTYYHNNCPPWITAENYSWSDFSESPSDPNPYGNPPSLAPGQRVLSGLFQPSRLRDLFGPRARSITRGRLLDTGRRKGDGGLELPRLAAGGDLSIDRAQVEVTLNGVPIIQGGYAVDPARVKNVVWDAQMGIEFDIGPGDPMLNRYNKLNPPAHRGWNLMIFRAEATRSTTRFVLDNDFGPAVSPQVDFSVHSWDNQEQGACAALGDFQCAGLVVAQGIPGFVTRDKTRGLNLVYASGRGGAPLVVPFDLLVPEAQRVPETITLKPVDATGVVTIGDAVSYIGKGGVNANVDQTYLMMENRNERRAAAVVVKAQYLPTTPGLFRVGANVSSTFLLDDGSTGVVANNFFTDLAFAPVAAGPFGRGWALAEMSQLYFVGPAGATQDKVMLVRGDGSIRVFTKNGTTYVAPAGDFTRLRAVAAEDGAAFVQSFQNGARIGFDASGRQVWTSDLVGNKTRFVWTSGKLTQITDPASNGMFGFSFDYTGDRVTQINVIGQSATRPVARLYYTGVQLDSVAVYSSATARSVTRYVYDGTTTLLTAVREPRWNLGSPFNQYQTEYVYRLSGLPYSRKLPVYRGVRATAFERLPWHRRLPRSGTGNPGNEERLLFHTQVEGRYVDPMGHDLVYRMDRFGGLTYIRKTITRLVGGAMCGLGGMPLCVPNDDETIIERDANGLATKVVHQRMLTIGNGTAHLIGYGDSTMIQYDGLGNPTRITRPKGRIDITQPEVQLTREMAYAYVDQYPRWCTILTESKDVLTRPTRIAYGARHPCLADNVTGIAGDITRFAYGALSPGDAAGVRPTSFTNALNQVVRFDYDPVTWNRNRSTSPSGLSVTNVQFDEFGRVFRTIDPEGHSTVNTLDWLGRPMRVTVGTDDPETPHDDRQVVEQVYDVAGNNSRTTVHNRRVDNVLELQHTDRFFNGLGLLDSTRAPNGEVDRIWYAHDGVVAGRQNRNGSFVYFAYDALHRVTRKHLTKPDAFVNAFADQDTRNHYIPGTFAHPGSEYRYTYNPAGQPDSVIEIGGSVISRTVYSDGSFRTERQCPRPGLCVDLSFQYDALGQRTQLDYSHASQGTGRLRYGWNQTTGRLDTIFGGYATAGGTLQTIVDALYTYDLLGRMTREHERISGITTDHTHNADGYQTSHAVKRLGATEYSWTAGTFDLVGNIKTYSTNERGGLQSYQLGYTKDGLYRLRSNLFGGGGNHYEYDVAGNRSRADTSTYAYDVANRLLSRSHLTLGVMRDRYYHDRSGNRISEWAVEFDGEWQRELMTYDAENRLYGLAKIHHWFVNDWALSWTTYDGLGRRVYTHENLDVILDRQESEAAAGGSRKYFIWDGDDVLLRFEGTPTAPSLKARYYPGPGVDGHIGATLNNGLIKTWYFIRDRQGSTKWLRDAAGELETNGVLWQYDPFGNAMTDSQGSNKDNGGSELGYTGASVGTGSGYVYLRNRYYDPSTGRFLTEDPIGFAGGVNFYAYADNNPVAYTDPFGLCPPQWMCDLIGASAGQSAVEHYAQVATDPSSSGLEKGLATVGGLFAALWTPDTYAATATTLATGAAIAGPAARIGQALETASTATGNVSVQMGSATEARLAGRLWTASRGSRPIFDRSTAQLTGRISGDATRVYRMPQLKTTGPNAGKQAANLVRKVGDDVVANVHLVIP